MANLFIPHWFGCFAGKKTIFKDSKNSPQSTKGGNNSNRNYDELLWDNNEIYDNQKNLRALICKVLTSSDD